MELDRTLFFRTQSATLRPMCGDIVQNSHDRAQILALWTADGSGKIGKAQMENIYLHLGHFGGKFVNVCNIFQHGALGFPAISQPFPPKSRTEKYRKSAVCGSRINAGLHLKVSSLPSAAHPWPGASLRSTWVNHSGGRLM